MFVRMQSEENRGDQAVRRFLDNLQLFSLAESLGGVESLVCHPASMTHAPVQSEALKRAGIGSSLVRLSVGLESADDLIEDLQMALNAASTVTDLFQHQPLAL